jgi:hypothetical protein
VTSPPLHAVLGCTWILFDFFLLQSFVRLEIFHRISRAYGLRCNLCK